MATALTPTSLRLSPEAAALVAEAQRRTNLSRTQLIEGAILEHLPRVIAQASSPADRQTSLDRLLALGGAGAAAAGHPSAAELAARSRLFRGED
jgi:hypothetical protein